MSNAKGSGVGVELISPEKEVLDYSLHFAFPSSNNLAENLKVKNLTGHSDSQLVVQQF